MRCEEYNTLPKLQVEEACEEQESKPPEKKKTSNVGTFLHIVKGNVGIGILALPMALSNFGLLAGIFGIILLGFFCIYCMHLLVFCSKVALAEKNRQKQPPEIQSETGTSNVDNNASVTADRVENIQKGENTETHQDEHESLDYATTAFEAFRLGPEFLRSWAPSMKFLVNLNLILTQFGFCCTYFLFTGQSLHEVSLNLKVLTSLSATTILAIVLPFMIALCFIPNLDMLASVSTAAVCIQGIGLLIMFSYFVSGPLSNSVIYYIAPVQKWPLFFGTAIFSFEGIGMVLPLENEIKRKKYFERILFSSMMVVVCVYLLIGVCGYIKYGADVKPSITFNLPVGCFSEVIRLLYAFAIFLSYPLQIYVPFTFVLPYLQKRIVCLGCNECGVRAIDWTIRALFVFMTFCIAVGVPMLDLIISLIGAFSSNILALILPPFIHAVTILKYSNIKYKMALLGFDIFLFTLGIFGLIVGTYTTITEMTHRNTTLNVASYNDLMSSGMYEAISLLNSKNSSCCSFIN